MNSIYSLIVANLYEYIRKLGQNGWHVHCSAHNFMCLFSYLPNDYFDKTFSKTRV